MSTEPTQISAEGLAELKAELEHLEGTRRKEISERIKTARDFGDLKENSEYHDAKDAQAILETRIQRFRDQLRRAEVVEAGSGSDKVAFGSSVQLRDGERELRYTLVSAVDADAAQGRLSVESPVAQALLGAREGQVIEMNTPKGTRRLEIVSIA